MPIAWTCRRCKGPPLPKEWEGKCPNCGGFYRPIRTFVSDGEVDGAAVAGIEDGVPISAGDLFRAAGDISKIPTGLEGFDWVLGGGLPKFGGAILLCSKEGVGKSTLLMVLGRKLAEKRIGLLYISAEQALLDLVQNFAWLGKFPSKHMILHHATDKDDIIAAIEKHQAAVYVVDSLHAIQNVTDEEGFSLAKGHTGAVTQIGTELKRLASERQATIFAVGHVNSDGTIKGGTGLRHMLDGTLVLRPGKDEKDPRRILEFEGKTRFGPRGRRALFEMRKDSFVDRGPMADEEDDDDKDEPIEVVVRGKPHEWN